MAEVPAYPVCRREDLHKSICMTHVLILRPWKFGGWDVWRLGVFAWAHKVSRDNAHKSQTPIHVTHIWSHTNACPKHDDGNFCHGVMVIWFRFFLAFPTCWSQRFGIIITSGLKLITTDIEVNILCRHVWRLLVRDSWAHTSDRSKFRTLRDPNVGPNKHLRGPQAWRGSPFRLN